MATDNPTPIANKREFSIISAPCALSQDATFAQIMDDLGCFLTASLEAFESMTDKFDGVSPAYAALYALRQANAMYSEAAHLVDTEWRLKANA